MKVENMDCEVVAGSSSGETIIAVDVSELKPKDIDLELEKPVEISG